jgi:tRNA pseudouridine13 synthase
MTASSHMTVPLVTAALPGTGGALKAEALDFVVEEVPLYAACGSGEHVYVTHRRSGRATRDVVLALARAFRIQPRDVGYAGLKDKRAVATQTFSLPLPVAVALDDVERRVASEVGGDVLAVKRHGNKLRRGHALGNRFVVRIGGVHPDASERARAIVAELARTGVPNAFGPQRYGLDGGNARAGQDLIRAGARARRGWLADLQRSAWQSSLFDRWLALRMERGLFERIVAGDVAKKLDNGALFDVLDEAAENERAQRREITHTGPIFGAKMRSASGVAGALEDEVFAESGITLRELAVARLEGTRRAGRIFVDELAIEPLEGALKVSFGLPKGSYATTVLREITKDGSALDEEAND